MKVRPRNGSSTSIAAETSLACIDCGHATDILAERAFKCPKCGNLYDVVHAYSDMNPGMVTTLKQDFNSRSFVYGMPNSYGARERSGVWRFHELIMPNLRQDQLITLGEGLVPIVPAGPHLRSYLGGDIDVWMILEGSGPTGSFKDFGGAPLISVAKAAGVKLIGCSSTGDTSAMLAAYAAAAGLECFVLLPRGKVTPVQLMQPAAHGARVVELETDFDGCMKVLTELVGLGVYPGNSLNPARIEGHKATVFLLAQFFRWNLPEWIAVPVGNGSNSSSVGKGLRQLKDLGFVKRTSRILGCQSESANPLARSWANSIGRTSPESQEQSWVSSYKPVRAGETIATATRIGDPVSWRKVIREICASGGAMETVSEYDLEEGMAACARDGHLVCPQTGIAIAGVRSAIQSNRIKAGQSVAIVSTATGMKFGPVYEARVGRSIEQAPEPTASAVAKMLGL